MKTTYLFVIGCFLVFAAAANAQTLQWAKSVGGNGDDYGYAVTVDANGNLYTAGSFTGTVDFDPGPGSAILSTNAGAAVFITKFDTKGNFVWVRNFGGAGFCHVNSITVDTYGNVYTAGYFNGTADFNPGEAVASISSNGSDDGFVAKLDADGNYVWAKNFGGSSYDQGYSVTVDAMGNVFTTGYFTSTADFRRAEGKLSLTSAGSNDIYVAKLDAEGNTVWAKGMGGEGFDHGYGIALDKQGNVYVTGHYTFKADFDPSPDSSFLVASGYSDQFVSKLDPNGNRIWAKGMGGMNPDAGKSITIDAAGSIYVAGNNENTYLTKMDVDGNVIWKKKMDGTGSVTATSVAADHNGNVYTVGFFNGVVKAGPTFLQTTLTSAGTNDIFIEKLDASGNSKWTKNMGAKDFDEGWSVAVDANGDVYATGMYRDTVNFDPVTGMSNLLSNGQDIFIVKYSGTVSGVKTTATVNGSTAYPNPTNGTFTVNLGTECRSCDVVITNAIGKEIGRAHAANTSLLNLNIQGASGTYFLNIIADGKSSVVAVVKQ